MCAIAGAINQRELFLKHPEAAAEILSSLKHRGPDQDGVYIKGNAALIHARLAVIDIENGRQPMTARFGGEEYTIVYNGELYNTAELRKELEFEGFLFETASDTEVVLKSYILWREKAPEKFNGIFGFAVWEKNAERLFLARDKMGVKPLFYSVLGDKLLFASEIKGILANPAVKPRINTEGIAEIMLLGPGRTPGSAVFDGIFELTPGECAFFENGRLRKFKYFELSEKPFCESFEETLEHTRFLVTDAIKRQLVSDVGAATLLSGGLDSSGISAVAAAELKARGEALRTYSVEYLNNDKYFTKNKFQPTSDDEYIKIMSELLGSKHTAVTVDTPELVAANSAAVAARDLPGMADVDSSLLLFCREIKKHETVVLSGECADEIFGGYPWYRDKTIRTAKGFPWSQLTDFRASLLNDEIRRQINPVGFVTEKYRDTVSAVTGEFDETETDTEMRRMFLLNIYWFMQNLLERKDRMSMASGLEVRVPFCDWRIAEYMYNVPWKHKDYLGREKGLLRKAFEDILPDVITWRKKSPYPKTHNPAYAEAVEREFIKLCETPTAPIFKILKRRELLRLIGTDKVYYWYGQLMATPQTKAYLLGVNFWLESLNVEITD